MKQDINTVMNEIINSEIPFTFNDSVRNKLMEIAPKSLYKYTAIRDYSLANLENDCVWMNSPRNFNDPLDCWLHKECSKFYLSLNEAKAVSLSLQNEHGISLPFRSFYTDNWVDELSNALPVDIRNKYMPAIMQKKEMHNLFYYNMINNFLNSWIRVSCFSQKSPDNIIMWSHYADFHKGMCLEYSTKDLFNRPDIMIYPVMYRKVPERNELVQKQIAYLSNSLGNIGNTFILQFIMQLVLSKSTEWAYEKEWRILSYLREKSDTGYKLNFIQPTHVYIGVQCGETETQNVISICKGKGIACSKMKPDDRLYKLCAVPCRHN